MSGGIGMSEVSGLMLVASDLSFSYDQNRVLQDVSLSVPAGSVFAVVGPNGSGKSTLLKVTSGYLNPESGRVSVLGTHIHAATPQTRSALVTYSGDEPDPAFPFSVQETVEMGRYAKPGDTLSEISDYGARAMEATAVSHLSARPITELSSGERQRVYLARAICQDPALFLLDEPTAHLDMAFEHATMNLIRRLAAGGKTFLTVIHDLNLALRYSDRILFMRAGKLEHAIRPNEVTPEIVEQTYGVKVAVFGDQPSGSLGHPLVVPV